MSQQKPLEGVRVIDLCVVWAGPFATMLMGDLGAEVIKCENPFVWQPMTRGSMARPPAFLVNSGAPWGTAYPDGIPGERPWNYCPTFVSLYRNKKSFCVDLRSEEGLEVLAKLVEKSDVVYENNATGTMEGLGITYDWLRSINPRIIMLRVPAYGSSGPYYNARALGVHLEAVMGHTLLRGYPDADPSSNTAIYSGDYMAGAQGAFAVMTALWQRRKTGRGQLIEIGQAENASAMFSQAIMDYTLNRNVQETIGNRDIHGRHPCGVYPCKSPGAAAESLDRWIAIHIEDDAQWRAFGEAIGSPAWASNPHFATNAGRAEHANEIDGLISGWTREQDDYEAMHLLQGHGIAAAPVLEASRMFADPQLRDRGFFRKQRIENGNEYEFVGPVWNFNETPVEFRQPPVALGEHNDYVYRDVLGMDDAELQKFRDLGWLTMDYAASVP
jgi:crotonobetainyl-CoA:carnitine CoA-transferase CaiB-like acyl-CoA transferase